ncbi:MAG TPA: hypothetical protein VEA59_04175 [Patescibacteria group bacterium]|nr:hypothetical protein [Patescibacteria group bacterium]
MAKELFPGLRPEEKIYIVVREHWVLLLLKVLVWVLLVVIGLLFWYYVPAQFVELQSGTPAIIVSLISQVYVLFLAVYLFLVFVMYYLNIHIITSERIVDIDQKGLFHHRISELHIEKMEDATSEVKGVLGTLFNYGDVYIQTAGNTEHFDFENVPDPGALVKIILDLYEQRSNVHKE